MRATNVISLLGEMGVAQKGCQRAKVAPTIKPIRYIVVTALAAVFLRLKVKGAGFLLLLKNLDFMR